VVSGLTVWIISKIKSVVWWLCIERSETVDKTLCQLAQKLLEMPSSSAVIERIFSNFETVKIKKQHVKTVTTILYLHFSVQS
jgi:allophanate hydrolase subunit 2